MSKKNKVEKVGVFFDAEKCPSRHHLLPATHHNFTTKTPHQNHVISRKPLQNAVSTINGKNT